MPEDLAAALGVCRTQWDNLAPSYWRYVLRWITLAKTVSTQTKRIAQAAEATAEGGRLLQM